jgi:hypothetical protein
MAEVNPGREALAQIDKALAERPKRDGKTLTGAIRNLAAFRDELVARHRGDGGSRWRSELEHANAVLSVVMAAEFPIGAVPWDELARARDWLDTLLGQESLQEPRG